MPVLHAPIYFSSSISAFWKWGRPGVGGDFDTMPAQIATLCLFTTCAGAGDDLFPAFLMNPAPLHISSGGDM
jgi:hypothetical protein